jgi:3-phenylpropionate/cinnamic acid dioxygenase small subunit
VNPGTVTAYEEIRNLLGTYCEVMDAADWAGLGKLFADGHLVDEKGREIARGAEAVTALWTAMVRVYDGSPRTRHLVSGPVITVHDGTALCRSSYAVLQQTADGALRPIAAGRYRDTFACSDGAWHFTERQFFLDQESDMSQHTRDL